MQRNNFPHTALALFQGKGKNTSYSLLPQYLLQHSCEPIMQLLRYMNKNQISVQVLDDIEAPSCEKVFPSLLLSSSFHLHPLISLTTFPYNLRTTDHLPKVPNPHSHQPPSCLCLNSLELLSLFFHCFSISQICKAINIASDQIFSRLPPFHHKSC